MRLKCEVIYTVCHFSKRGNSQMFEQIDMLLSAAVGFQHQDEQLKTLFAWAKEPKLLTRCRGCEIVGIQVRGEKGWKRYGKGEVSAKWESWCVEFVVRGDELYVICYFSFIHTYALTHFWNLLNTFDYFWLVQRHLRLFWNWTSRCRWTMVDYDDFVQYLLRWCEMWNLWFKRLLSHQRLPHRFCNGFPGGQWKLRQVCGDHIQKQVQEWSVATEKRISTVAVKPRFSYRIFLVFLGIDLWWMSDRCTWTQPFWLVSSPSSR